ncbi:hypothetical protein [[Clostridium] symbiosum]|uniref:hypothetical protein n=1 Tax=Clostridium symbiosum TaxID=1512 RepID=UPI0034A1D741
MALGSIVDYLKSQGKDSSYSSRKKMAEQYGIGNYSGTAAQNTNLLKLLQNGSENVQHNSPTTGNTQLSNSAASASPKTGYNRSDRVNEYYNKVQDFEANTPESFNSNYQGEIDNILDSILNKKDFSYTSDDLMNDDLYKMYRDSYMRQGNMAMRDTMGNASAMTGGYGNTYASAAGQQAYDNYLSALNDKSLEFADRAYNRYRDDIADNYNQLNAVMGLDNVDYSRYRDDVGDYYTNRDYLNNRYNQEYNYDYGQYQDTIAQQQWAQEFAFQQQQAAQEQARWAAEMALKSKSGGSSGRGKTKQGSLPGVASDNSRYTWAQAQNMYDEIRRKEGLQAAEDAMLYLEKNGLVDMYKPDYNVPAYKPGVNVVENKKDILDQMVKMNSTEKWRKKWKGIK